MKVISTLSRQHSFCLALLCFVVGFAPSAFAVPPEQVLHVTGPIVIQGGPCCFSFNQTITVTEPAKPTAVVVTFAESKLLGETPGFKLFGLMVNGGPCKFYGSGFMPSILDTFDLISPRTFQWVVFPTDGLRAGSNTFTLCGGQPNSTSFTLESITLAARRSN